MVLNANSDWKALLKLMPGRTHASLACRNKRLLDMNNPNRSKQQKTGLHTWSAKRAAIKREKKATAAEVDGVYSSVSRVVERAIWNVRKQQKYRYEASVWAREHRNQINDRKKHLRKTDAGWRVQANLRSRLADYVRTLGAVKKSTTEKLIGCQWDNLQSKLQEQLLQGESLLDKDVDHIFPMKRYVVCDMNQQRQMMHFSNLQPLTPNENSQKSAKLPTKAMAAKVERWAWPDGVTEDMLPDIYPGWATALRM